VSAFSEANDASFDDDNIAEDASWLADGENDAVPVRIILATPDVQLRMGQSRLMAGSVLFQVRQSEVSSPEESHRFVRTKTGQNYEITGEPQIDDLGLNWHCEAIPVAP